MDKQKKRRVNLHVAISVEAMDVLDAYAQRTGQSRTAVIESAIMSKAVANGMQGWSETPNAPRTARQTVAHDRGEVTAITYVNSETGEESQPSFVEGITKGIDEVVGKVTDPSWRHSGPLLRQAQASPGQIVRESERRAIDQMVERVSGDPWRSGPIPKPKDRKKR